MASLWNDLRYGLRLLRHAPGSPRWRWARWRSESAPTLPSFHGGRGAAAPLPFADPDRVVMVWEETSAAGFPRNTPRRPITADWKKRNHVFTDMAATRGPSANLTAEGPPEQVIGARDGEFLRRAGCDADRRTHFTEEEDRDGAPVAMISYALWQRRYAGSPDAVNRDILINGLKYSIIGVMPRDFSFRDREMDFWVPAHFSAADLATRGSHYLNVVARLKPGVTVARAQRGDERDCAPARRNIRTATKIGAVVVPTREETVGDTRIELLVLMGAAGCVLLIACANLAGLLLARGLATAARDGGAFRAGRQPRDG